MHNIISDINFLLNDTFIIWTFDKSFDKINNENITDYEEISIIIKYAIFFLIKLII